MASSISRPGCNVCAEMRKNLACGVCVKLSNAFEEAVRKRRNIAKSAFKKRGIVLGKLTSNRATLRCSKDHAWSSSTSRGKDDEVEQPKCDICNGYFVMMNVVKGTLDESIPCGESCKNAHTYVCKCSCAGAAHGIEAVGAKA